MEHEVIPDNLKMARRSADSNVFLKEYQKQEEYLEQHKLSVDQMAKMLNIKVNHHHQHHHHHQNKSESKLELTENSNSECKKFF